MRFTFNRKGLLIGICLLILPWVVHSGATGSAKEINPKTSLLADLVVDLMMQSDNEQRAFALIALDELYAAYKTELEQVGETGTKSVKRRKKRRRWASATNNFLANLLKTYQLLGNYAPLRLYVDNKQKVLIVVGDQPIVVSGPRIGDEVTFEKRIIERYCNQRECLKREQNWHSNRLEQEISAPGGWLLGQNRKMSYLTRDGLLFEFNSATDRVMKGEAALAVVIELRRIVTALTQFQQSGGSIDWTGIVIRSTAANEDHLIELNNHGDFLRLWLPNLHNNRNILHESLPWVRARVNGDQYQLKIRNADHLLKGTNKI